MADARPSTPPSRPQALFRTPNSPLTPEQTRRIEINRLKAKALREQKEAEAVAPSNRSDSLAAGRKRSFTSFAQAPPTIRDGRAEQNKPDRPLEAILPARNFTKYVEYDFSKMTDTLFLFLSEEVDLHNKALHSKKEEDRPASMTLKEWERAQLLRSLRNHKAGPFEPGISALQDRTTKKCTECGILEIDWMWDETFGVQVCNSCKDKVPDKYSLLTKTEAKEDYLLTDPELRDESLLPHLERPNPHKSTWNNMMLFLRCQVEEYAFSDQKWGSAQALDEEFAKREVEKKKRKESKFKSKLADLKKRTRVEAHQRNRKGGVRGNFGDDLGDGKHVHDFGRPVDDPKTGMPVKTCIGCGLEVEELDL